MSVVADQQVIRCPAEHELSCVPGETVHFPKNVCVECPLKAQCTTSAHGCSSSIHPDEALLIESRERQHTPQGRARLRERVAVEHTLAHVGRWPAGTGPRYPQEPLRSPPLRRRSQRARSSVFAAEFQEAA
jgi:Transposase DDE domain